jgi:SWIM/SEC-C metal-binding protein
MSKLFFKGRIEKREQYQRFGYNTNRQVKLGTLESPLTLLVNSQQRQKEVEVLLQEHGLHGDIQLDPTQDENILELETLLHKPSPQSVAKKPNRNALCPCGSAKKFKKCCAK